MPNLNLEDLTQRVNDVEKNLMMAKGQRDTLENRLVTLKQEIQDSEASINRYEVAAKFLTQTAKHARDNTIQNIESLATMATQAVYDEQLEIKLHYKDKFKSDTSDKLRLRLVRQTPYGEVVTGLMNEVGGGVIETVSFALRIACIKWLGYKGPIILDEAYKSLSNDEKLDRIASLLQEMSITVGNQIILSTHKQDVFQEIASKTFVIKQEHSISEAVEC